MIRTLINWYKENRRTKALLNDVIEECFKNHEFRVKTLDLLITHNTFYGANDFPISDYIRKSEEAIKCNVTGMTDEEIVLRILVNTLKEYRELKLKHESTTKTD